MPLIFTNRIFKLWYHFKICFTNKGLLNDITNLLKFRYFYFLNRKLSIVSEKITKNIENTKQN